MSGEENTEYPDLLKQIVLNDASRYEEIALKEALAFEVKMSEYFIKGTPTDFKETYCNNYVKEKIDKFASYNKFICSECNMMELIGQK